MPLKKDKPLVDVTELVRSPDVSFTPLALQDNAAALVTLERDRKSVV